MQRGRGSQGLRSCCGPEEAALRRACRGDAHSPSSLSSHVTVASPRFYDRVFASAAPTWPVRGPGSLRGSRRPSIMAEQTARSSASRRSRARTFETGDASCVRQGLRSRGPRRRAASSRRASIQIATPVVRSASATLFAQACGLAPSCLRRVTPFRRHRATASCRHLLLSAAPNAAQGVGVEASWICAIACAQAYRQARRCSLVVMPFLPRGGTPSWPRVSQTAHRCTTCRTSPGRP